MLKSFPIQTIIITSLTKNWEDVKELVKQLTQATPETFELAIINIFEQVF